MEISVIQLTPGSVNTLYFARQCSMHCQYYKVWLTIKSCPECFHGANRSRDVFET